MKPRISLVPAVLFSTLLLSGCSTPLSTAVPAPASEAFYASGFYDRTDGAYGDAVDMSAAAEWTAIEFGAVSIRIPYSPAWTVERNPLLPISPPEPGDTPGVSAFRFGRFIQRSSMVREYALSFERLDGRTFDPAERTSNDCPELTDETGGLVTLAPTTVKVGEATGTAYLVGDSGGCSTNFDFEVDGQLVTLAKIHPSGQDDYSHGITPEMREIISGIRLR